MVTQGCVVVTAEMRTAGSVTVSPGNTPIMGTAQSRRTATILGRSRIVTKELTLSVVGTDLVINLAGTYAGDAVCWTAYD